VRGSGCPPDEPVRERISSSWHRFDLLIFSKILPCLNQK
jgi:hypothetical protein